MALPKKSSYLMGGTFNSAPFTLTDGDLSPLQVDANGNLLVNLAAGSISINGNAAAGPTGAAVPADADYQGVNIAGVLTGVTGLALGATTKAPTVAIVDGSGNQITSFGGGTQYADNVASGVAPTGTLAMGWDSVNSKIRALKVDSSQNLLVDVANTSLSVTQGTSPWVISFNAPQHIIVDSGSLSATQGTSPWVVSGTIAVQDDGIVDSNNSTTAILGSNGVFTGTSTDMLPYTSVRIAITSDKSGTASVQWSEDNVNWDFIYSESFTGGNPDTWSFGRRARFFRIVYTNGAVAQTFFRLQVILQRIAPPVTARPIGIIPDDQDTGELTQSVIIGHTTAGGSGYVPVKVNPSGTLTVDASNSTGLVLGAGTAVIGHVIVDSGSIGITGTVDVSDRAARLVGVVYGSQGQQLKQTATNFNLQVELATGATLYDARQIRALTSADVVTVVFPASPIVWIKGNAGATLDSTIGAATAPTNALAISGVYQSTIPALTAGQAVAIQVDTTGSQNVNLEGRKATYSAVANSTSTATFTAAAGDIAVLPGSASKTIRVTRIEVTLSTSGTAAIETVSLIKRSAADTGGTSSAMTIVPHDSNFGGATAAPLLYTVAPTPGAAVGIIRATQFNDQSASLPGSATWIWTFGDGRGGASGLVLRGTAEEICVNLSGVVSTQSSAVSFEWTEE